MCRVVVGGGRGDRAAVFPHDGATGMEGCDTDHDGDLSKL